jgi:hypothetical protein
MPNQLWQCLSMLAFVVSASDVKCGNGQCDAAAAADYVENHLSKVDVNTFRDGVSLDLLQHASAFVAFEETQDAANRSQEVVQKCRRRCRYHPKHDCRLICRVSCVKGKPVENPKCKNQDNNQDTTDKNQDTTTTTTSKEFTQNDPPTPDQTCKYASTLKTTFATLKENTLGEDVERGRLLFKDVVELSKMLIDKEEWKGRKFDLIVEDASQKPKYVNNPEKNVVSAIWEEKGLTKYVKDKRNFTGTYLGTVRIGVDNPGSYVFRFTLVDSETGQPTALPLFPLTFYDVDGQGEIVSTCDAARVISVNSKLEETVGNGCFVHHSQGREVNLPKNFEQLTLTQKSQSVTYVYANKASFDLQLHLEPSTPQRYFVMKSSNVLACTGDIDNEKGNAQQWKNAGQPKEADA